MITSQQGAGNWNETKQIDPDWAFLDVELAERVKKEGYPNAYGARIPIKSGWKLRELEKLLKGYHDKEIIKFLRYGWPANRVPTAPPPTINSRNHSSAIEFPEFIDKYIKKEIELGGVMGPFSKIPFSGNRVGVSPLSTRPKKDPSQRRTIMDLSCPDGRSVNDHIPKDYYLGLEIDLRFPNTDDLARRVAFIGKKAKIWKIDLSRAFRQYPLDPGDYELFGFTWGGLWYWDKVLVMGHRSAPYIAQRISDAVAYIIRSLEHFILNYIDDFVGADEYSRAVDAYHALLEVLDRIGLQQSPDKAIYPCPVAEFLGVTFNAPNGTIEVSPERLVELVTELQHWEGKEYYTRTDLESIIGKLQFVTACVRPGRVFICRLLNSLRETPRGIKRKVDPEMAKDLSWWKEFMPKYNGVSIMWPIMIHKDVVSTDASLRFIGGYWKNRQYFRLRLPQIWTNKNIAYLELWAVLVAVRAWGAEFRGKRVHVLCDNQSVVAVLTYGRSRDLFLQAGMREMAHLLASYEMELDIQYVESKANKVPDWLSRWSNPESKRKVRAEFDSKSVKRFRIDANWLQFRSNW